MSAPCPGPCNGTWRRAEKARELDGQPHTLRPVPGQPVWCTHCADLIRARLVDLDDLVALLQAEATAQRAPAGDDPVSGTPSRPSPAPIVDDIDEITRALEQIEAAYRTWRRWPAAPPRAAELRVMTCTAWLDQHLDGVLAVTAAVRCGRPLSAAAGAAVLRLHRLARARTATDPAKRRMPVPCSRCDMRALTHHSGDTYVACEACGRLMLLQEYDAYVLELARSTA